VRLSSTWKHLGIALATLAGLSISASVLWALYGNALMPPERLLPANTAVMISNADAKTMHWLKTWIPQLHSLPTVFPETTVALIPVNGKLGWVTLTPVTGIGGMPYAINASLPEVRSLIGTEHSLEESETFQALAAAKKPLQPQAYVNTPLLGSGTALLPWPWLRLSSPALLLQTDTALEVSLLDATNRVVSPQYAASLQPAFAKPLFAFQSTDAAMLWKTLGEHIDEHTQSVIQSLLTDALKAHLGKDLSVTYDILPLLRDKVSLQLAAGQDGSTHFLLEGTLESRNEERLQTILRSFETSLPAMRRETLTFEENFVSDTLAQDERIIEKSAETIEDWEVRRIVHKDTKQALALATKGQLFMLSDSPEALETRLRKTLPLWSWQTIQGSLFASGMMSRTSLMAQAATLPQSLANPAVLLPEALPKDLLWSLIHRRGRFTLRLEPLIP
jgi:hypothetical protein